MNPKALVILLAHATSALALPLNLAAEANAKHLPPKSINHAGERSLTERNGTVAERQTGQTIRASPRSLSVIAYNSISAGGDHMWSNVDYATLVRDGLVVAKQPNMFTCCNNGQVNIHIYPNENTVLMHPTYSQQDDPNVNIAIVTLSPSTVGAGCRRFHGRFTNPEPTGRSNGVSMRIQSSSMGCVPEFCSDWVDLSGSGPDQDKDFDFAIPQGESTFSIIIDANGDPSYDWVHIRDAALECDAPRPPAPPFPPAPPPPPPLSLACNQLSGPPFPTLSAADGSLYTTDGWPTDVGGPCTSGGVQFCNNLPILQPVPFGQAPTGTHLFCAHCQKEWSPDQTCTSDGVPLTEDELLARPSTTTLGLQALTPIGLPSLARIACNQLSGPPFPMYTTDAWPTDIGGPCTSGGVQFCNNLPIVPFGQAPTDTHLFCAYCQQPWSPEQTCTTDGVPLTEDELLARPLQALTPDSLAPIG